jgi:Carboxypeptidase regulatory-like domain/TonB dependent receptor-like, beta-barrel
MPLRLLTLLILSASLSAPALAQSIGRIAGTVTDNTGSAVVNAVVEIVSLETGETRRVATNTSGTYAVSPLPVGSYRVQIRKEGFKGVTRNDVRVDVNSAATVDVQLEVGAMTESVTVQEQSAPIETETAAVGNSRYETQLKQLPVIVREVQTLVGQTAGVPYGTTDTVGGTFNQGGRSAMQIVADGAQVNPLQTTGWPAIDGIGRRADLSMPSMDALQEVRWATNGGAAEYSQPTQVIAASKSGTNALRGSLFEFYRSGGMGARRWEAAERESFVRHQFGGAVGGPIRRDKMFFFGSADVFRHTSSLVLNARYPTAAERGGNLSSLLARTDAAGNPAPIRINDPLTGQPFAGNIIPANRISPVAAELFKLIPDAPQPARLTDFNAVYTKPQFDNSEKYDARFDYNVTQGNRVFARATIARLDQASRYSGDVPGPHGSSTKKQWNYTVATNWTSVLSASTIAVFQFSYRNLPFRNIPSVGDELFSVPINDLRPAPPYAGPPAIAIGNNGLGISPLFDRLLFNVSEDYGYTFDPNITKVIGNHTFKAGFTYLTGRKTTEIASPPYGRYTTVSDFNNARSTTSATGDAFADFLLGYPSTTDVTIGEVGGFHKKTNYHAFIQDDWKVTPRLTLNLGLRYDNFGFFEEEFGRAAVADFATGRIVIPDGSAGQVHPAFQQFSNRYVEAGALGLANTFIRPNNRDFAPRIGGAYRITPSFVARGGFGVYYVDYTINEFRNSINVAPFVRRAQLSRSLLLSQNVNVNQLFTFQNPTANSNAAGADTQLTTLDGFNPDYPTMRLYSWNFTLEKDLGWGLGLRSSYVGNVGRHLSRSVRVNACPPGPTECLSRAASDPTGRKWTQFGIDAGQRAADGESNYNAWEIELQKRFSNGLLFDLNYAFARAFNYQFQASNPVADPKSRYDYGPVAQQPKHILHWNYVYELPYGSGKRWGASAHRIVNALLGGWQMSGIGTWQSGTPLTVTAGAGQSPTGAAANRADRIADGKRDHGGLSRGEKALQWFNTSAYRVPASVNPGATRPTRQFGTAGIGTVVGPSFFTFDAIAQKNFVIAEKYKLQFRLEVFNPFNAVMLGDPDVNASSSNFGRIRTSNPNYSPRSVQLGFRLDF